jgi:hypothetical protein
MKISFTLPSVFPDDLNRTLDTVYAATRTVDYEIVVVSRFEVSKPKVKWVREDEARGCVPAHAVAFANSTGDFVLAFSDDVTLAPGWDADAMANFHEREPGGQPFSLGLNLSTRIIGTVFGIYYPFFPLVRRSTLETLGFFSDSYQAHFADSDLALRIWEAGGRCEFSSRPLIVHHDPKRDEGRTRKYKSLPQDMAIFSERWKAKYGRGWNTSRLEDFNLDINPATQLTLVSDNTVWLNDPLFKQLYDNFQRNIESCQVSMTFPA